MNTIADMYISIFHILDSYNDYINLSFTNRKFYTQSQSHLLDSHRLYIKHFSNIDYLKTISNKYDPDDIEITHSRSDIISINDQLKFVGHYKISRLFYNSDTYVDISGFYDNPENHKTIKTIIILLKISNYLGKT